MSAALGLELSLDTPVAAAGGVVGGSVPGADEVELVRRERTPGARGTFHVAFGLPGTDGRFQLDVPKDAPPSTATDRCTLGYGVIARRRGSRRQRAAVAEELEITCGEPHAHTEDYPRDRLIASFDARGFHVELADAALRGGGRLRGRVHGDRATRPAGLLVSARFLECWRLDRGWNVRYQPIWRDLCVWEADACPAAWLEGATWAPFEFSIPAHLPPAVEGRILAWRYEIEARRPLRFVPDQRAVITPIGFQAA
ncbi:MAG: hypothetical protein ACTHNU_08905 [Gaiellales bacterium]